MTASDKYLTRKKDNDKKMIYQIFLYFSRSLVHCCLEIIIQNMVCISEFIFQGAKDRTGSTTNTWR